MSDYSLNILHLYPDHMNLYGDKGNIEALRCRLLWREIDVNVKTVTGDESFEPDEFDIIFLGGGSDRDEEIVIKKLMPHKDKLKNYVENGGTFLAVCGGFSIIGKKYAKLEGLGILDITTSVNPNDKRLTGNVILNSSIVSMPIVGFENHPGRCEIGDYTPLGEVVLGNGNDGKSKKEGVVYKNLVGTHLHGPLLPKNPELCDYIIKNALKHKYSSFSELKKIDDSIENFANNYVVQTNNR